MPCGCGTIYTDEEIDAWIVTSKTSERLMDLVRENTRAMQDASGVDLLRRVYEIDAWRNRHLKFLSNEDTERTGNILKKHVARLVDTHIAQQMKDAVPFEPIVIKQRDYSPSR